MKKKQVKKATARKVSKSAKRVAHAASGKKPAAMRPAPRSLQRAFAASDRDARQGREVERKREAERAASAAVQQPTRKPSEIKVGKRFRTDKGDITGLAASIDARGGLLQPICVDVKTGELIDGERRLIAWGKSRYAGSPIPVFPVSIDSIIAGEWDANAQRKDFTYSEAVAIKRAIEGKLHAMAKQRTGRKGEGAGRAADQASLFVGKKRRSLEKAEQVIEAAEADPERFGKLKEQMDRTGRVDGSFKRLQNIKRGDELRATPPCIPMNGPYHTAAIDLPWPADLGGYRDQESRGYYPYATMSMAQLAAYAREQIAPVLHADCAIWLWIPNFHLVRGCHVEILKALGAEGSTMLTWAKPVMGQGQRLRGATEHAILAIRGDVPVLGSDERTWFEAPPSDPKHSAKPVDFFQIVEKVTPAPRYAYFFAPGAVPENWDGHGDRIGQTTADAEQPKAAQGGKKKRGTKQDRAPAFADAEAEGLRLAEEEQDIPDLNVRDKLIAGGFVRKDDYRLVCCLTDAGVDRLKEIRSNEARFRNDAGNIGPDSDNAHTTYDVELGMPDVGKYRQTPEGQSTVADLAQPGAIVTTSYDTGPYRILSVDGPYFYKPGKGDVKKRGKGVVLHWSLSMCRIDEKGNRATAWINELVAVDGKLLKLFEANTDEVIIQQPEVAAAPPAEVTEQDDGLGVPDFLRRDQPAAEAAE